MSKIVKEKQSDFLSNPLSQEVKDLRAEIDKSTPELPSESEREKLIDKLHEIDAASGNIPEIADFILSRDEKKDAEISILGAALLSFKKDYNLLYEGANKAEKLYKKQLSEAKSEIDMHTDSKKHITPTDANNVLANVFTSVVSLKFFAAIQRVIGEFNLKIETHCSLGENDVEVKIRYADFKELEKLNQRAKGYSVSERKVDDV